MIDSESAQIFRTEAQELFEHIEHGLLDLERNPDDSEIVAGLFRALHTLKGSGAMFGFDALAAVAHRCETAFDRIRKGKSKATPELIGAALVALDHMHTLADGGSIAEDTNHSLFDALDEAGGNAPPPATQQAQTAAAPLTNTSSPWHISMHFPPQALRNGTRPLVMFDELRVLGQVEIIAQTSEIPALDSLNPQDCYLAWSITLTTDKSLSVIEDVFSFDALSMDLTIKPLNATADVMPLAQGAENALVPAPEAEPAIISTPTLATPAPIPTQPPTDLHTAPASTDGTLRIPALRLDTLMDRVGELVIAQSRLRQVASTIADTNLDTVTEEIERLAAELRESMMSVRMVPIAQLFGRFRRLVRDLARETGKRIEFITSGETTELDKTVIERLADPLIHLIRNSADHGLETAEDRRAAGKSETGIISLSAFQAGAEVIIAIEDDGRGVDRDKVRARAETNGLITPGQPLTDEEVLQLLFQPGFSTASKVTGLSGRGVGMDVVKRAIDALRGTIEMSSEFGHGSRILLRIPLTLAIIDGLLVRVADARYVIPLSVIEECIDLPDLHHKPSDRNIILLREGIVPFIRLCEVFDVTSIPDGIPMVVVVSIGNDRVGLVVDQIIGDHQTVIKPLSSFHIGVGNFSGATILGDGSVALILDASNLISIGRNREERLRATG
ncbi:MAG: chemotaxis protein CheA [Rhizomicrobium sp.]